MSPAYAGCLKAEVAEMVKKLMNHICCGFTVTAVIALLIQILRANACKSVVTDGFAAHFASREAAALAQLGLIGLIGAAFSGAALVFEIERWSYLRQGVAHFLITAAVWVPVAWLCWSPYSGPGLWLTILGWTLTYCINWLVQYAIYKRRICELNRRISAYRKEVDGHEGD